jgi:chorismate mutase
VPDDTDPVIQQFRDKISDNDRALVEAVNARLRLVAQLKAYKESRGIDFVDPEREEWILRDLERASRGPLSAAGLRALYEEIFALTKREVARDA